LHGFPGTETINFSYQFPSGKKADGTNYSGTSRSAYLPTSPEGITTFKMFVTAFERRLSFTIGTSLTTGATNTVVWAGIHHKTSTHGGPFGFPDNSYLNRVEQEFAARNITPVSVANVNININ
jgi:deltex-like protein